MFDKKVTTAALAVIVGLTSVAFQAENTVAEPTSTCDICEGEDGNICCPHIR